jgi:hypothetical protein
MIPRTQPKTNPKAGPKAKPNKQKGKARKPSKPGIGHNTDVEPEVETNSADADNTDVQVQVDTVETENATNSDNGDDYRDTDYYHTPPGAKEAEKRLHVRLADEGKLLRPPPIDPALMSAAQPYINDIKEAHAGQVEGVFKIGKILCDAKDDLDYGVFGQMIERELPFGRRMAQIYMEIARHPILADAKCISHLPPSVAVIYELTSIPNDRLEEMFADGTINPELRRSEVVELRKRIRLEGRWHLFPDLKRALCVLVRIADRYPNPEPLAKIVYEDLETEQKYQMPDPSSLAQWLAKLAAAVVRLHDEDEAKEKEKAEEQKNE